MRFARVAAIACFVLLALPAAGEAAQRYASPSGTGPPAECPQANPCSLTEAVTKAKATDEVIVLGGEYTLSSGVVITSAQAGIEVHGDTSGPMPKITGSLGGSLLTDFASNSKVGYLEFQNAAAENPFGLICTAESVVERVRVSVIGKKGIGVFEETCLLRDSLVIAAGQNASAIRAFGGASNTAAGAVVNATAIATGIEAAAIRSAYEFPNPGSYLLTVKNSIVSGPIDVEALQGVPGPGSVTISHSNFDTHKEAGEAKVIDAGGNQSAPPLFVNAEAGDYREAAGSPTIDAGAADPQAGPLDLTGKARTQGSAIDIGAYEFIAPPVAPVTPAAAGQLQSLAIAPATFRALSAGGAVVSAAPKKAPRGATVNYGLSAAGTVAFTVERKTTGRKVGKRCVKRAKANASKKKCPLYRKIKGSFTVSGVAGQNHFKFSGRIGNKPLKPGSYRLAGVAGGAIKTAVFKIVK